MSRKPRAGRNPGSVPDPWVLGIDPSLTRTAAVLIPPEWVLGDWASLRYASFVEPMPRRDSFAEPLAYEKFRIERMARIAERVAEFVLKTPGVVRGFIEGYGYTMGGAGAHSLAEFGGILRYWLVLRCGLVVEPVQEASARKLLLGKLPKKDRKLAVQLAYGKAGAPFNSDEADAMTVASWGMSEIGLTALSLA